MLKADFINVAGYPNVRLNDLFSDKAGAAELYAKALKQCSEVSCAKTFWYGFAAAELSVCRFCNSALVECGGKIERLSYQEAAAVLKQLRYLTGGLRLLSVAVNRQELSISFENAELAFGFSNGRADQI